MDLHLGFETIGNATLIFHDRAPILVTDPWIEGSAYFGSWKLSHEVPAEQREAVRKSRYVWFSHGHPDHLNADSLPLLGDKEILLPNHVGGRIERDLLAKRLRVRVLPDRTWIELSPKIRILCISDYNQDAVLLVDVGGRLVVNLNDASDRGWGRFVRRIIRGYPQSFLLALHGYGDADMLNYFDESGRRLPLPPRAPLGQTIATQCDFYGSRYFIPFSSMHRYQRTDSAWASKVAATLSDYQNGFQSERCELLPAFIRYDCEHDRYQRIDPPETPETLFEPERFGDSWSDPLDPAERQKVDRYFRRVERLGETLDFVNLRVGGRDQFIALSSAGQRNRSGRGLTLEAPRRSLMESIEYEVIDDLLIANFAKVTLHGDWGPRKLYPHFTPFIAKYADNGRAFTKRDLDRYFAEYRRRDPAGHLQHLVEIKCLLPLQLSAGNALRGSLGPDSTIYRTVKKGFWLFRKGL